MPTFTAIALDSLLETRGAKSKSDAELMKVKNTEEVIVRQEKRESSLNGTTTKKVVQKKHHWTQISPALYTTPEATPVPDTPSSFNTSPYIINHKRRGASLAKRSMKETVNEVSQVQPSFVESVYTKTALSVVEKDVIVPDVNTLPSLEENADELHNKKKEDVAELDENEPLDIMMLSPARDEDSDNFFDPRDSLSYSSYSDGEDSPGLESSVKFASSAGEFYDAPEELSTDSSTSKHWQPPPCDLESELRGMKLALLAEIEERKQAEDALQHLQCQWLKLREHLSHVGITPPSEFPHGFEADPAVGLDLCDQINIARFVSEAVGRGIAKAEAEIQLEAQLELKNFEISRLNDRLHYYEAVNQEMSQRNQEVMESARRLRQQRKRRQRWMWGSLATAITLGTAVLAWSYFPADKGSFFINSYDTPIESDKSGN